jgi:hypothetical protein
MQKFGAAVLLTFCSLASSPLAMAEGPFPRLLPPPEDFHLTLREEPHNSVAPGPSCGGEASLTLLCRAFTLTLKNAGRRTIHISELRCFEPDVVFEMRESRSSSGWRPVSQPGKPACGALDWINIRLKPEETTEYTTRLIAPRRSIEALGGASLGTGSYKLRAHWALWGCTEAPEGTDCLTSLQVVRGASSVADVALQEPVTVLSNEVTAESPPLLDLGNLKFSFEVTIASAQMSKAETDAQPACAAASITNVDCTVFHYVIRNLADRPVRNATASCSDTSIRPEYRFEGSEWKSVPYRAWGCTMNVLVETQILPGGAIEGTFTLRTLRPGFDTSALQTPGEYQLRFTFWPNACIASPDASFCLTRPERQPTATSKEFTLRNRRSSQVPISRNR